MKNHQGRKQWDEPSSNRGDQQQGREKPSLALEENSLKAVAATGVISGGASGLIFPLCAPLYLPLYINRDKTHCSFPGRAVEVNQRHRISFNSLISHRYFIYIHIDTHAY